MNRSSKFAISYSLSPTILNAVSLARSGKEEALSVIVVLERESQGLGASDFHKWHDKLVHRLLNPFGFAAGQLAVFQGASEAPIPPHFGSSLYESTPQSAQKWSGTGRASNAEKQPTGRGPEGCVENGPAAALLVGYVSIQICALLAPCRRSILNATTSSLYARRYTGPQISRRKWI